MSSATDIIFTDQKYGGITAKKLNLMVKDLSDAIAAGGGGGTGTGDMLKSVYDTNNNGKVDTADAIPWTAVTGKPTSFTPSAHAATHNLSGSDAIAPDWTQVQNKPSTFPPDNTAMLKSVYDTNNDGISDHAALADSAPWTGITGKPATFPPSAHGTTHLDNGSDTVPVVTTTRTGLTPILSGDGSTFLNGNGGWSAPQTITQGQWTYRTGTGMNDPGSGRLQLNNASAGSATQIAISAITAGGTDRTNLLASLQANDVIQVQDATNIANWIRYRLTANAVNNTGWFLLNVVSVTGSGTTPGQNDLLTLSFTVSGGSGSTGGDMTKAVYDTNANGVVDTCDSLAWSKLTGIPATFAPAAHAPSHLDNGSDPLPVATTSRTGSLRALNGTATTFLDGTGNWSTPAPSGTVNPGTWTNLTYSTGWTQNTTAQYRVETNGSFQKVIAQGIINYASGAASLAFTLSAGARPSVQRGCVLGGYDSSGDTQLFQAVIAMSGAVNIYPITRQNFAWPSATNGSVYLDGLVFSL